MWKMQKNRFLVPTQITGGSNTTERSGSLLASPTNHMLEIVFLFS